MRSSTLSTWQMKNPGFRPPMKPSRVVSKIPFAIAGAAYLSFFSSLTINPMFKSYVAIVPIQLAALAYGIYLIKKNRH